MQRNRGGIGDGERVRAVARAGDRALLAELGDVSARELHAAAAQVRVQPGVLACIVGQSSLLAIFRDRPDPSVFDLGSGLDSAGASPPRSRRRELVVSFAEEHGPDLHEFLRHVGVSDEHFLRRLDGLTLTARYLGFRGGFAYLDGWPAEWSMPRRPTSRPRVPRGTFAIAGGSDADSNGVMAGFYPLDSPGGWNLLGRTGAVLAHAIEPGDELVLRPTLLPLASIESEPVSLQATLPGVELLANAQFTTVVAAPDYSRLARGVPEGGAFDELAATLANRAVGNGDDAPLFECALVGPRLRFTRPAVVAWYGATCAIPSALPLRVRPGDDLAIGPLRDGLRGWLAIGAGGGVAASPERGPESGPDPGNTHIITAVAGPHDIGLRQVVCEVTPQLDRVGIRLRPLVPLGPMPLDSMAGGPAAPAGLRSCGMLFGTVQLHPDGSLVVMGPEHPVTGGYLQPMTVPTFERWKLAQLRPGERVIFDVRR